MKIETAIKNAYLDLKKNNIKTALLDVNINVKSFRKDRTNILNSEKVISDKD